MELSHSKNKWLKDLTDWSGLTLERGDLVEIVTPLDYSRQPDREIGIVLGTDKLWDSAMIFVGGQRLSIAHYHLRKIG
jgi:hypothetical protein